MTVQTIVTILFMYNNKRLRMKINTYIDHTALKASTKNEDIKKLCDEAIENKFAAVCVNLTRVKMAKELLKSSGVKVCTVVGFPLGATFKEIKAKEASLAIANGADEIDMVINIQALLDNDLQAVKEDIREVLKIVRAKSSLLKVIIETCLLNETQIKEVCSICVDLEVDFVKTSTGFSTGGATLKDVKLMKSVVKESIKIKASGGVKNVDDALEMIEAGASRIGTSSGVRIINSKPVDSTY